MSSCRACVRRVSWTTYRWRLHPSTVEATPTTLLPPTVHCRPWRPSPSWAPVRRRVTPLSCTSVRRTPVRLRRPSARQFQPSAAGLWTPEPGCFGSLTSTVWPAARWWNYAVKPSRSCPSPTWLDSRQPALPTSSPYNRNASRWKTSARHRLCRRRFRRAWCTSVSKIAVSTRTSRCQYAAPETSTLTSSAQRLSCSPPPTSRHVFYSRRTLATSRRSSWRCSRAVLVKETHRPTSRRSACIEWWTYSASSSTMCDIASAVNRRASARSSATVCASHWLVLCAVCFYLQFTRPSYLTINTAICNSENACGKSF